MILRLKQWFLTTCCLTLLASTVLAGKPGSGGGTPPPPVLPNVRYHVDLIPAAVASVNQISNAGVVVGSLANPSSGSALLSQAFLYDQDITGRVYDLNNDSDLQPLQDQLTQLFGPEWFFQTAIGINDRGMVVGRLRNVISGVEKGFALDTFGLSDPALTPWTLLPLPEIASNRAGGTRINSTGDVLGVYQRADNTWDCFLCNPWLDAPSTPALVFGLSLRFGTGRTSHMATLNNWGHVAGSLSDGTPFFDSNPSPGLPSLQTFRNLSCDAVSGLNDSGVFCAWGQEKIGTKSSKWGPRGAFRYDVIGGQSDRILDGGSPAAINASSDVVLSDFYGKAILAYKGSTNDAKQLVKVTDLIPDNDPAKSLLVNNFFEVRDLNDRDSTGFGQLLGHVQSTQPDGSIQVFGVILRPFTP